MAGLNKNITVRLMADATAFNASIKAAGENAQKLSSEMEASGRKSSVLVTGLAAAGVAAGALGAAAVKVASDFDASMSGVQSATRASASEMDLLREAAIQAGADTIYGASDAAGAIEELGKAGISTTDILNGGLSGALDLAASDGMDVAAAAGYMSTALKQFNLDGSDATHVADLLAAGAGNALGNVSDMGEALNNVGSTAYQFNMSLEDTVGVLAAFASAGIVGAEGGTQLRSLLLSLTNQTDKQKEAMKQYGIVLYDQQGKFVGLANLAGQLQDKLGGLSEEQRNNTMAMLFGSYAIQGANILYKEGAKGIENWTKKVDDSGYAAEMAAARTDNLKGDLEQLSGSVETLMIGLGDGAQGPLRSLVQTLDTVVDAFSGLPKPVQQWILLGTAAVGGAAALHKALGDLGSSTSGLARNFSMAIDPVTRFSSGLPKLREGFALLTESAATAMTGVDRIPGTMSRGSLAMSGFGNIAGGVIDLMGGPWGIAFTAAGSALLSWARNAQQAKQAADSISTALESGSDGVDAFVKAIQDFDIGAGNGLPNWIDRLRLRVDTVPELLDQCGLSIQDLALAAQGNTEALDKYNEAIKRVGQQSGDGAARSAELASVLDRATKAWDTGSESSKQYTDAVNGLKEATSGATASTEENTAAMASATDQAEDYGEEIDSLIDKMFSLEGVHISAYEAQTQLQSSIQSLTDSLAQNGNTLDINTEQGRSNRDALANLASQAQDTAQAILEEGQANRDMTTATETARTSLENARTAFINAATAAGMNRTEAENLANQFGLTGNKADELSRQIQNLNGQQIGDKSFNVTANTSQADAALYRIQNGYYSTTVHVRVDDGGAAMQIGNLRLTPYANGGAIADTPLMRLATGDGYDGLLSGWGGKKSDNMLIAASPGEFMQQASAVDYYGVDAMRALNERKIPREWLAGPQGGTVVQNVTNKTINITIPDAGNPQATAQQIYATLRLRG